MPETPAAGRLRYFSLVGRAVLDEEGRLLGHLEDLVVERRGDDAVVSRFVVAPPREVWPIRAFRSLSRPIEIEAGRVRRLDERGLHVEAERSGASS